MGDMTQQINFLHSSLKPKKQPFNAVTMSIMTGIAVLVMTLFTLYGYKQTLDLQSNVDELTTQKNAMQTRLDRARETLKPREKDQLLTAQQLRLEGDLHAARRLAALLRTELGSQGDPYSAYFRGLAESTLQGLWLKQLVISHGGQSLNLTGETLQPELLPRLLQTLSSQKVFKGHNFNNVLMSREQDEKSRKVLFELKTNLNETEQNDAG